MMGVILLTVRKSTKLLLTLVPKVGSHHDGGNGLTT